MILAIDMGNSNIKIGVIAAEHDIIEERVTTALNKTSMEYAMDILSILSFYKIDKRQIDGAILASVVPPLTGTISTAVRKVLGFAPLIATNKLKLSVHFEHMKYPEKVGADLVVGAEAAFRYFRTPVIIINMGTATTITVVDSTGAYQGGVILPGLRVSLNSLSNNAAQLPYISLESPGNAIADNTVDSMRSGILYGNAGQIDGIIDRMEAELGEPASLVATGGLARFVVPHCRHQIKLDDALLMRGLLLIYQNNEGGRREDIGAAAE